MTLLVRDEQDVIEANIGYHLSRGIDHIIVTDNNSTDATRDIVRAFERAGTVTIIDEPGDDYSQAIWVTRMARLAAQMGADWVINADADEMWWPREGDLKKLFAGVPRECGSVTVRRHNMLPLRILDGHPFEKMVFREVCSLNAQGLPLPGKVAHRAIADVYVEQGNHAISSASLGPNVETDDMSIFHFPHRSYAQFERKIANGGAAYERNVNLSESIGATWRALYRALLAGSLPAWYGTLAHADDAALPELAASGAVVEDRRLSTYLQELTASRNPIGTARS
jgi:Glycosyl transferase family 2